MGVLEHCQIALNGSTDNIRSSRMHIIRAVIRTMILIILITMRINYLLSSQVKMVLFMRRLFVSTFLHFYGKLKCSINTKSHPLNFAPWFGCLSWAPPATQNFCSLRSLLCVRMRVRGFETRWGWQKLRQSGAQQRTSWLISNKNLEHYSGLQESNNFSQLHG